MAPDPIAPMGASPDPWDRAIKYTGWAAVALIFLVVFYACYPD